MYALCVSGAVNTQGFVWKLFYALYKFSFIHSSGSLSDRLTVLHPIQAVSFVCRHTDASCLPR